MNADDGHTTFVNGTQVSATTGGNNAWQTSQISDIKPLLVAGTNVIAIAPFNGGNAGSLIAVAELDGARIVTDDTWKTLPGVTATPPAGWNTPGFDDSTWLAANVTGAYGIGPWNQNIQTPPGPTVLASRACRGSRSAIRSGSTPGRTKGKGHRERRLRRRQRVRPHTDDADDDRPHGRARRSRT